MHDDAEDHATLKRHHERLEMLCADLDRSPSRETIDAMLGACAAVRQVDNPLYRYVVEQIVWIKGPLESSRGGVDLSAVGQGITRFGRALRSPALREGDAAATEPGADQAEM